MKKILIFVLSILLLAACNDSKVHEPERPLQDDPDITGSQSATNGQGENTMEEILLTKEEFVQLMEEYDVGVTIRDFEGIDIEDFIFKYRITEEYFDEFISMGPAKGALRQLIEWYIEELPSWEREKQLAPYLVRELKYVDSTEEEYKDFIDRYFSALQMDAEFLRKEADVVDVYVVEVDNKLLLFKFCQTIKSKGLPISRGEFDKNENYSIHERFTGETSCYENIHYSKSSKYLMYLGGNAECGFEEYLNQIKTFCELDD